MLLYCLKTQRLSVTDGAESADAIAFCCICLLKAELTAWKQ